MSDGAPTKVLVSGSAGFIGFKVASLLLERGCQVVGVDNFNGYYCHELKEARAAILRKSPAYAECRCDIADAGEFKSLFEGASFDIVCHLAAQVGVRHGLSCPEVYTRNNVDAFMNVLEMVRRNAVPRLVYASSSSVYGGNTKIPFSESDRVDSPISPYAVTKRENELMAHCYAHLYGIQTVGLRFFTVYGPWGRPDMAMWSFADSIMEGKPISIFNYGKMKRDFTYVDDIAGGVVSALFSEKLPKSAIMNLGNHRSEELMNVISIMESHLGRKAKLRLMPLQAGDVPETYADIALARELLGYEPKTSISKGIPEFLDWFTAHPDLADAARKTKA